MPVLLLRSLESSTHEEVQSKDFKSGTSGYGGDLRLYLGEAWFAGNGDKTVRANCRSNRVPECFPERFQIMDIIPKLSKDVRQVIVDHYSAIYTIEADTVTVLRVLYGASDLSAKLQGRLS